MTQRVYLDHHATTPLDPQVLEAMAPFWTERFGNPGSIGHIFGEESRLAVENGRGQIAALLGVHDNEVVFTSGATESNNLALRGVAERRRQDGGHVISVATEHKAVLDPLERLKKFGFEVTLLEANQNDQENPGCVSVEQVRQAIRPQTCLVSVMLANNEIGTLYPVQEIAEVCHERDILLHCDATQAIGKLPVNVKLLEADLLSFSGHKIYGPRGMGVLIVRRRRPRIKLTPLIEGGGQQEGRRSGTLNVPGIVGLACALRCCVDNLEVDTRQITELRDHLWGQLYQAFPTIKLNGPRLTSRLPGNLNLQFPGIDGEALMMHMPNIAVSSGSACTSANPEPSHVLRAIGLTEDETRSSLRFGLGRFNTRVEIDYVARTLIDILNQLYGGSA